MRSGLEERRERGSFGLSTAVPPPRSELTEVFRRSGTILPIPPRGFLPDVDNFRLPRPQERISRATHKTAKASPPDQIPPREA
jgi:hypothetical protein